MKGIIGRKVGMTRVFTEGGEQVPVTVIEAGPCTVVGKRTLEKDKYTALQLGFGVLKEKQATKAVLGQWKKRGLEPRRVVKEFRVTPEEAAKFEVGQVLKASDLFKKGQLVDVRGVSKGRGFQGVFKRHHMAGFVDSHGTHEYFRHPGSIGQRKTPGRVFKNKRMPGHMGVEKVTTQNLMVVDVDAENDLLLIKGSVPGNKKQIVLVQIAQKPGKRGQRRMAAAGSAAA